MAHTPRDSEAEVLEQRFWADVRAWGEAAASERDEREQELWARWGVRRAVLFTDLSGFSRTVAAHGIAHFLELIRRKRALLDEMVAAHRGRAIKREADSMLVVFDAAADAVDCALAMQRACQAANVGRAREEHLLLCVGVAWGEVLEVGTHDVWGSVVNAASVLGEDTARAHEILCTDELRGALGADCAQRFVETELVFSVAPVVWRLVHEHG